MFEEAWEYFPCETFQSILECACGFKLGNIEENGPGPAGNVGGDWFFPFWTCGGFALKSGVYSDLGREKNWRVGVETLRKGSLGGED